MFRDLGYDLIVEFMKPNLIFDREITERRQKESLDIVPRSQGVVLENELIVDANMRITEDILLKLNSLSSAITKQDYGTGVFKDLQSVIGTILLLSMIISLFFTFIVIYRKTIFEDWKMVLLISIVFLFAGSISPHCFNSARAFRISYSCYSGSYDLDYFI